jgi:peptidoglycan/xylan/chitin deacetylase (PgdA/CDA1 family)
MSLWKRLLIGPYYYGTSPFRRLRNAHAAAAGRAPVMIVYYHRVADDGANSWTISHAGFRRQIGWLRRHFELVSLEAAQRRIAAARNFQPCVSITFDDGYAENCREALPWLIQERVPFTYFVTTDNVFQQVPFPHDVSMGHRFAPNTVEQLRELAAAGVEIGGHSRTHADLGKLTDLDVLYDEVVVAGEDLSRAVGVDIRYFAFPFGLHANLHRAAFRMAREAGYAGMCSAYGGYNFPRDDAFHLQRIGCEGPLLRLKNWLTVDPIKQLRTRRYEYLTHEETKAWPAEALTP